MLDFLAVVASLVFMVGLVLLVIAYVKKRPKKRAVLMTVAGFVLAGIVGSLLPEEEVVSEKEEKVVSSEKVQTKPVSNQVEKKKKATSETVIKEDAKKKEEDAKKIEEAAQEKKKKELLNVHGSLKAKVDGNKIIVDTETNLSNGAVVEINLLGSNLNVKNDYATVKDGKAQSVFNIPAEWKPSEYTATAFFKFTNEKSPQMIEIKRIYGMKGEKMTGSMVNETDPEEKFAVFDTDKVVYPSKEALATEKDRMFDDSIAEMKDLSEGIILDIRPQSGDWDIVNVTVSDSWYYSPDYEKERFAEQIGGLIQNMVLSAGKAEGVVHVYFVDSYGKQLATPKILGGYKIKK